MIDHEEGECSDQEESTEFPIRNHKQPLHTNFPNIKSIRTPNNIWSEPATSQGWNRNPFESHDHRPFERKNRGFGWQNGPRGRGHFGNKANPFSKGYEQYLQNTDKFEKYYCDRCDRGFKYQNQLDEHNSQHVKCAIDGCAFYAHPKIVQKHVEMQHESSLASRIMGIKTPEDIEKWKAERKRNYPTASNVADKKAALQEKRKRGEMLGGQRPRLGNKKGPEHQYNPKERRFEQKEKPPNSALKKRKHNRKPKEEKVVLSNPFEYKDERDENDCHKISDDENDDKKGNLPRFTGTNSWSWLSAQNKMAVDSNEIHISDDEDNGEISGSGGGGGALGGLTSLMSAYGSDSGDDAEPEIVPIAKAPPEPVKQTPAPPTPVVKESIEKPSKPEEEIPNKKRKIQQTHHKSVEKIRPQRLTLLQKLLQNEIRHERNVVLQCVYYTLRNNFFDSK